MENYRKAYLIIGGCITLVIIVSVIFFVRMLLLDETPYEQIEMEQALEYMEYEEDYLIVDARPAMEYVIGHIPGALNIPVEDIKAIAPELLPEKDQMIYVYGEEDKQSRKAARMLCKLKYTNITEIGSISEWSGRLETGQ